MSLVRLADRCDTGLKLARKLGKVCAKLGKSRANVRTRSAYHCKSRLDLSSSALGVRGDSVHLLAKSIIHNRCLYAALL